MFRDFGRRLQRDVKRMVDCRLKESEDLSGGRIKASLMHQGDAFLVQFISWMPNLVGHVSLLALNLQLALENIGFYGFQTLLMLFLRRHFHRK